MRTVGDRAAPVVIAALPERRRRSRDGVLIEAKIVARLLGLRLLKLDAFIVLTPADASPPAVMPGPPSARPPVTSSRSLPARSSVPRSRLAEAVRDIDEAAEILDVARRDRSSQSKRRR